METNGTNQDRIEIRVLRGNRAFSNDFSKDKGIPRDMNWKQHYWRFILVTIVLLASCRDVQDVPTDTDAWTDGLDSPSYVAQSVIDALNDGQTDALHKLRVNEDEYLSWVWPEFSASQPPMNFPGELAWANLNKTSFVGVQDAIASYSDSELTLVDIRIGHTEGYGKFRLLQDNILVVRKIDGEELNLRFLGSIVERDGRYKLLSYRD